MPPVLPQSVFAAVSAPDVEQLFGVKPTSVAEVTGRRLQTDLHYLAAAQFPDPEHRLFSVAKSEHLERITRDYITQHPLGFLSQTLPYFRPIMMYDAVYRDSLKMVAEFRHTVLHMAKDAATMADQSEQDLWGTATPDEKELAQQFRQSSKELNDALQLFDNGDVDAALAKMSTINRQTAGYAQWFKHAHLQSEDRKRLAHLGVTVAAGFAAAYTGGASLVLFSGGVTAAEASLVAHGGALLVNGATFVTTHRLLNQEIFDQPFFTKTSWLENAVDLGADTISAAAMIGSLKLMGAAAATIPASSGELAWALDGGKNFAFEYTGFTGYNIFETGAVSFINPHAPGIESTVSRQALLENLGTLIGLKAGGAALQSTLQGAHYGAQRMSAWFEAHPAVSRALAMPALLAMGALPSPSSNPVTVRGVLDAKKRGQELTEAHIRFFIKGIVDGSIPDYQAAAFLMAVRLKGMTARETTFLTQAMTDSGKSLDLSGVQGVTVDKHSTGGISDGTSFIVAALLATFGLKVPMMSGRGLGHTGGTLDKLEAIPGFRVSLTAEEIVEQLNAIGLAIFGQTPDIAPADKKLYALRDVTETVDSIPLIVGSIMSKKLAEGAQGLVMNVTTGSGAFMRELNDAKELAEAMVAVAQQSGRKASAVISSMDQPLAPFVGNALEIQQAVRILKGETARFERFIEVSIELAAHLMVHGGLYTAAEMVQAREALRDRLASGAAFEKFREMVAAQGGDVRVIDDLSLLPQAAHTIDVVAPRAGFVSQIDATQVGLASVYLGAGRETAGAPIDPAVGLEVFKFLGDPVAEGELLARLYVNDSTRLDAAQAALVGAYTIDSHAPGGGRGPLLATVLGATTSAAVSAATSVNMGVDLNHLDRSARPQDDFFQHVNGGWLTKTQLPPGVPGFGNFGVLRKANADRLQATVEGAMRSNALPGSYERLLGDFYASGMDVERLNQLGAEPLTGALKQLDAMTIGNLHNTFAWFHRHALGGVFTLTVEPDPKRSDRTIVTIDQGGLGLPTRDHYLMEDAASVEVRAAYRDHLVATFKLLGLNETTAQQRANSVLLTETALARSTLSPVERRDLEGQYNKMDVRALRILAPNISWDAYFTAIGATDVSEVIVKNPAFLKTLDGLVASTHPAHWHAYFTWHLVNSTSDYLGDDFANRKFELYGRKLEGASEPKPRARRVLEQADALIGDALGKVFVEHHFNPEAKQQVDEMVRCIVAAFRERILTRPWMSAETKAKALEKLDAVAYKIGHPDHWRDYSSVEISRDSYFQNAMNARAFEFARMVGKLGKPVDRSEWNATAPTVNANYVFEGNEMTFSAGILQPPFFNATADAAVNFGAIGAMIGHELTHGFDDQGAKFDARGNMSNWWTAEDAAKFGAKGDQLAQQFDQYEIQPGQFVLGKLTLGENIADLGGIAVAYHALQKFLDGKARVVVDGYTPEQRFFLGYAQMWRAKYTPEFAATNFRKDVHSPARFRVLGPLSNMQEFHEAFGVQPGDAMWRDPQDRIEIW